MIYKKGVVRTIGKSIPPNELLVILNSTNKEAKLNTLKEMAGQFDPDIVIDYIRKWIAHYRILVSCFFPSLLSHTIATIY